MSPNRFLEYARRVAMAFAGGLVFLSAAGCGFQPLYGENNALNSDNVPSNVIDELSQISVAVSVSDDADGRGSGLVGFETRNQLIDLLGSSALSGGKYKLQLQLRGIRRGLAVQSDASVTRFNYFLQGNYRLLDNGSGRTILTGRSRSFSAYNVVDSEFATVTGRRDAEFRAARNIAEDLKLQLALFFKSGKQWRSDSEENKEEDAGAEDFPSYEKGSPRLPDDRPVGTPRPEEEESATDS